MGLLPCILYFKRDGSLCYNSYLFACKALYFLVSASLSLLPNPWRVDSRSPIRKRGKSE